MQEMDLWKSLQWSSYGFLVDVILGVVQATESFPRSDINREGPTAGGEQIFL